MSSDDAAHPQSKAFLSNYHNCSGNRLDESFCGFNQSGTTTANTSANFQINVKKDCLKLYSLLFSSECFKINRFQFKNPKYVIVC